MVLFRKKLSPFELLDTKNPELRLFQTRLVMHVILKPFWSWKLPDVLCLPVPLLVSWYLWREKLLPPGEPVVLYLLHSTVGAAMLTSVAACCLKVKIIQYCVIDAWTETYIVSLVDGKIRSYLLCLNFWPNHIKWYADNRRVKLDVT